MEQLYSRQIFTIGKEAQTKIGGAHVLISWDSLNSSSGLGVEVAKCLILSGVKKISIHTTSDVANIHDLSSNYYLCAADVDKPYMCKLRDALAELNSNVIVEIVSKISFDTCQVVIFCDWNQYDLLYYNKICREQSIKFIALQSYGLAGNVFCDFGECHVVVDDGEQIRTGMIVEIKDNKLIPAEKHNLYTGDVVQITGINGIDSNKKYLVKSFGKNFEIKVYASEGKHINHANRDELYREANNAKLIEIPNQITQNVIFTQVKIPENVCFKSLQESLDKPTFITFNDSYSDIDMNHVLHAFMIALSRWKIWASNGSTKTKYPEAYSIIDFNDLYSFFVPEYQKFDSNMDKKHIKEIKIIVKKLTFTCAGKLIAIDSIIGAIGAQEAIKAITYKFIPNCQFLHYDALDLLIDEEITAFDIYNGALWNDDDSDLDLNSMRCIFRSNFMKFMKKTKVFIVGSGAIGCEHLKNFAMMGINDIVITDMDRIERSNLSRQFLFRETDIGQPKSLIASSKAKEMNHSLKIVSHEKKVGPDTLDTFNAEFYENVDVVANALDNVEARLFVDSQCVKYRKPLLESGTLGTKGNIQSIVPYITESYGSFRDPPEENIAVCTLKLFPYKYEHIVQFSRDLFQGYFHRIPSMYQKGINNLLENATPTDRMTAYEDVKTLIKYGKNFKHCIHFAYMEWHKLFRDPIVQIIKKYPENHLDDDGNKFWGGNKRFPHPLKFDDTNEIHIDFIIAMSNIWANVVGIPDDKRYPPTKRNKYVEFIERLTEPEEVLIDYVDSKEVTKETEVEIDYILEIKKLLDEHKLFFERVDPMEFEKDDDTNHHIDFVYTVSNLRALNYSIDPQDKMSTKQIAGKIIPALATTTSIVSGLVSIELLKLIYVKYYSSLKEKKYLEKFNVIERYKSGCFNLGIQMFSFAMPQYVPNMKINGKLYNIWTVDDVNGDSSLEDLIELYNNSVYEITSNEKVNMEVGMIYHDQDMIYNTMMKSSNIILKKKIRDVIPANKSKYLTISLDPIEDEENEEDEKNVQPIDAIINVKVN